jgi:hypothetical protein
MYEYRHQVVDIQIPPIIDQATAPKIPFAVILLFNVGTHKMIK